ncbi:MAG: PilZ domain-containing protein [Candidatus Accumulibacter sp. UW25]|jgi:hypothetical protein
MADERRQYSRIAFAAPARLLLGEQALPVEVLDLSQKGALLRLPDLADPVPLAVGTAAVPDLPLFDRKAVYWPPHDPSIIV